MSDFNNNILIQNNSVIEIIDLVVSKKYQYNKFTIYDMFVRQILFDTKQAYTIYNIFNVMKWIVYNGYLKNNFVIDLDKQIKKYSYIRSYNNFYKFNNIIVKITNVAQLFRYNQDNDNDNNNQNQDKDYESDRHNNNHIQNDKDDSDEINNNNNEEDDKYDDEKYKDNDIENKDINDKKRFIYNNNKIQQLIKNKEVGDQEDQQCISYQQSLKLFRNIYSFNNNDNKNNHDDNDIKDREDTINISNTIDRNRDKEDTINTDSVNRVNSIYRRMMIEDDKIDPNKIDDKNRDNVINNNNNNKIAKDNLNNYEEIIF